MYGGTPSDQSIVRCIRDLKSRGFKVVFYPFLLRTGGRRAVARPHHLFAGCLERGDGGGERLPRLGRDVAVLAANGQFDGRLFGVADRLDLRRMILHYANLCVVAGGVESFRHRFRIAWPRDRPRSRMDASRNGRRLGSREWDYPFVAGLVALAEDVRSVFDAAGFTKNLRHSQTSSLIRPTGRTGWASNTRARTDNGRISTALRSKTSTSSASTITCRSRTGRPAPAASTSLNWSAPRQRRLAAGRRRMIGLGLSGSPTICSRPI